MKPFSAKEKAILARFEALPDSAAASLKICSIMSGISERTWRDNPPIPVFKLSCLQAGSERRHAAQASPWRELAPQREAA